MGKLFAVVLTVITLVSASFFILHTWWMPVDISVHGPALDKQFGETLLGTGIGFVVAQLSLAFFVCNPAEKMTAAKPANFPAAPESW